MVKVLGKALTIAETPTAVVSILQSNLIEHPVSMKLVFFLRFFCYCIFQFFIRQFSNKTKTKA